MVLSFHISPCARLNAIKRPSVAAFITMSMKAFAFLFTHYVPVMLSSGLSSKKRKQDDSSFVCHSVMIWLVASYREGEDDAGPTHLRPSPNAGATDPHCQQLRGQR